MSQSSTASNLGNHARNTTGRSNSRARTPPRKINFTVVLNDETFAYFVLNETANVGYLEKMIQSRLNIPIRKQFIYGWPNNVEPSSKSVKLRDLFLPTDVQLYVAIENSLERDPLEEDHSNDEDDTRVPSTSQDIARAIANSPTDELSTDATSQYDRDLYDFTVEDTKNNEVYNDISFAASQTVKDVKEAFASLTCIQLEHQEWSGWPENATDESCLKEIGLDIPVHSLVLSEFKKDDPPSVSDSAGSQEVLIFDPIDSPDGNSESLLQGDINQSNQDQESQNIGEASTSGNIQVENLNQPLNTYNVPPIDSVNEPISNPPRAPEPKRTARKSTSKQALLELRRQRERNSSNEASQTDEERRPSTSRSGVETGRDRITLESVEASTPKKVRLDSQQGPSSESPRKTRQCHLFKLPKEVVNVLLQYLDPVTELSLRRACKTTKEWVSRSSLTITPFDIEKWRNFYMRITETGHKTFENVATMGLPISNFIFEVDNDAFYETEGIQPFIAACSLQVRKLTLGKFFMFQNPLEQSLLETFQNIEELTLNNLTVVELSDPLPCPSSLGNLKVLKLNYEIDIPQHKTLTRPRTWSFTWGMLSDCRSLLYFRFPRLNESVTNPLQQGDAIFAPLLEFIQLKSSSSGVALEYLDLKHFNNTESNYLSRFNQFLSKCYKKDIKLKNVNALVLQAGFNDLVGFGDERLRFCENVISLVNYSPFVENSPMSNLEKLKIDIVPSVTEYSTLGKAYKDIFWPKLRSIKIIDSYQSPKDDILWRNWQIVQEDLYGQNGTFPRYSVRHIRINSPRLPYFLGEGKLAQKFVNLKRLEICSWYAQDSPSVLNKRLWPIWKKLRLEELKIENCKKLNDHSFIGGAEEDESDSEDSDENDNPPVFLALRRTLKKMTLGMDGMAGVTDRSFIKVFSRMKLQTFILHSSSPTKISERAILKLLNGSFGCCIERFPFDCWSTSSIDPGRFSRLADKFRSRR